MQTEIKGKKDTSLSCEKLVREKFIAVQREAETRDHVNHKERKTETVANLSFHFLTMNFQEDPLYFYMNPF